MTFANAIAVQPSQDTPGLYRAEIHEGWDIAGNANGGYLLAIAARALSTELERPDPVSITAHYLAPGRPGPVTIDTSTLRAGRSFATGQATLAIAEGDRAGRPLITALGSFSDLEVWSPNAPQVERVEAEPPTLPPPDDCIPSAGRPGTPALMQRLDLRLHPEDADFINNPSGQMKIRGWFRWPEGDPALDVFSLLLAVDAFPPTIFNARLPIGWVPTLELTAHVRARPEPGWLRCQFSSRFLSRGFLEEDGEVWDDTGRLVAQSRQLALLPRAR